MQYIIKIKSVLFLRKNNDLLDNESDFSKNVLNSRDGARTKTAHRRDARPAPIAFLCRLSLELSLSEKLLRHQKVEISELNHICLRIIVYENCHSL